MINLLPPDYKTQMSYARTNLVLRRWLIGIAGALGGLIILMGAGYVYMASESKNLNQSISSTKAQLSAQNLEKVQKDATEISGDVKVINQVLSREVRFSDLIQDMGKLMPSGTVLGSLSLAKINGAIDLSASSTDYTSAAQIAINLSDSKNGLFSKVDIVNISCGNDTSQYKCSATFKALFSAEAQKKYLSVATGVKL